MMHSMGFTNAAGHIDRFWTQALSFFLAIRTSITTPSPSATSATGRQMRTTHPLLEFWGMEPLQS
jgi:hypothetical protein